MKILQKQQQMDKLDKKSSRAFSSGELKMTMIKMLVDNDKECMSLRSRKIPHIR